MRISRRDFIRKSADLTVAGGVVGMLGSSSVLAKSAWKKKNYKRKVEIQKLTLKSFRKYGSFGDIISPTTTKIGAKPIEFYRDMVPMDLGDKTMVSFSSCRVCPRPPVINVMECHSTCCEGILPINTDIFMFVGVATPKGQVPLDTIEVFDVPMGTFVSLLPGTWHHGPFVYGNKEANILIALPRRTYVNDCTIYEFPESEHIEIIGG